MICESKPDDYPPAAPTIKLLQFGPLVTGYRFAYAFPVVDSDSPREEKFAIASAQVDAFGLAEVNYAGPMFVEPVALFLSEGNWLVAQENPAFAGVYKDGESPVNHLGDLDDYYASRLMTVTE